MGSSINLYKSSIIGVTCCLLLGASSWVTLQEKLSPQEAFFLRRINEFWKDHDYALVKKQINEFLSSHEVSTIHNNLYALLGDILYQENDYVGALAAYNQISDPFLIEKSLVRKSQCLYLAGQYDEVVQLLAPVFQASKSIDHQTEAQFIFADSLFRKMRAISSQGAGKEVILELAVQAKPFLLALFETSYKEKVLLPLAEIHRELGESKEAASCYRALSDQMPLQKEELLLQAAALQMEFDPLAAMATFQQIVDLGGAQAPEAAYHELLLLAQNDLFSHLVSRAPQLELYLAPPKKPLLEFYLARSHFKMNQTPEAIHHYNIFLEKELEATPQKQAAFIALIQCAQKTDDIALFDRVLAQFLKEFPKDEEAAKALLLHGQAALQRGDLMQASCDLNQLLKDFPHFPDQETLLYDQALLLSKTQQWEASRWAFIAYLDKFPSTPHSPLIWSSIVHASVQQLKYTQQENVTQKKEQLISDLARALTFSDLFAPDEEASYRFLLGQLMFDVNHYSESIAELDHFCKKYPQHPSAAQAYLLQALAHRQLGSEPVLFIAAAEKALAGGIDTPHKAALGLQLFNAYLLTKQYSQAADTLYQAFIMDGISVHPENQLWLAGYYLERAESAKSVEVYKKALRVDENDKLNFDPTHTYLEGEVLKFVQLLSTEQKQRVLLSLVDVQTQNQALPWKQQGSALLELAKTYLALQKQDEALKAFETLIGDHHPSVPVRNEAILHRSRILLSQCTASGCDEKNETIQAILSTFKDLQIQKQLAHEPIHLEAALDYTDLRIALAPEVSRVESALFFLRRVKEDFNAQDDQTSQEYHEARRRLPQKDQLFLNYMKCIEAEIFYWESKEKGADVKGEPSKEIAGALFEELLQDESTTPYLKHRAQQRLTDLRKSSP